MFLALILSCMIAGSLACSNDHCKDRILADKLLEVDFLPDEEQLEMLCPKIISFMECERKYMECPGQTLEELAISSNKLEASEAKAMLGGIGLIRDVCDKDSSFHSDYVANVYCYREYFNGRARNCRENGRKYVEEFFDQLADEDTDDESNEFMCLVDLYELVCVIDNLGDACGDIAQKQAHEVLSRLKVMYEGSPCKRVLDSTNLKTRFLDFLKLDEQRKNRIQGIFDLLKRRR